MTDLYHLRYHDRSMRIDDGKSLMLKFQRTGDNDACRRLFLLHRDALWRFLLRLSGSKVDANDMSQRVWLKIIEIAERNAYRPRSNASFQTYLFTIARNLVIDEVRTLRARAEHVNDTAGPELGDDSVIPMHKLVDNIRARKEVRAALEELPLEQREVLAMWAEGLGFDEIASIVDAPRNTVIGRKRYGLEKLRTVLDRIPNAPLQGDVER